MEDKRRYNRWLLEQEEKAVVSCAGVKEEVKVLDVSAGGMRVSLSKPMAAGSTVYGQFRILPNYGLFYVRGKVIRTKELGGAWETAVVFERVSTAPLEE